MSKNVKDLNTHFIGLSAVRMSVDVAVRATVEYTGIVNDLIRSI